MPTLCLAQEPEADQLLSEDPFALLIGMVLDQQFPIERAFASPLELKKRLGGELTVDQIAAYDPDELTAIFCTMPALHRYPAAMCKRVIELSLLIIEQYDGNTTSIWTTAKTGTELVKRIEKLPGFGKAKARIFTALLAKQFKVKPTGWQAACAPYGDKGTHMSVADITSQKTLDATRAWKQEQKALKKAAAEEA